MTWSRERLHGCMSNGHVKFGYVAMTTIESCNCKRTRGAIKQFSMCAVTF